MAHVKFQVWLARMNELQEIPLFPLRVVLFPGGRLDLQIFEQRYIDLVTSSLKSNTGFGICLLKHGDEVVRPGSQQTIHRTGTYAVIIDWDQLDNGLLGITIEGQAKFRIMDCWEGEGNLLRASTRLSNKDDVGKDSIPVDERFSALAELLRNLESHPLVEQKQLAIDYNNLWDLGWRLGELIPIAAESRQSLLELDDPWERVEAIEKLVSDLANGS